MDEVTEVKKNGIGKKIGVAGIIVAGLAAGAYALVKKFGDDDYIVDVDDDEFIETTETRPIVEENKPAE